MKFTAVGDALIQQRIRPDYKGFDELVPYIMQGDVRFFNLETTLCAEGESFASQFSGGTYLRAGPGVLDDMKRFGFNITTFNNNHAMDFSYGGLLSTLKHLDQSGLAHTGVGKDIDEASAPCFLDTASGRVAMISVSFTFDPSMMAGRKTNIYPGRPGVNGMRLDTVVQVTKEDIEYIRGLEERVNLNAEEKDAIATGYAQPLPPEIAKLGDITFTESDKVCKKVTVKDDDFARVQKAIEEAKCNSDYIMVSFHTHEMYADDIEIATEFTVNFAHRCIDLGANAVIGHGPHLLRAIEVYKDSPVFYSLGDFILELYSVNSAPDDFYRKYGMTSDSSVYDLLKKRSKNFTIGLMEDKRMTRTVIPFWETEGGKLKTLRLLPVELETDIERTERGLPRKAQDTSFMDGLAKLSAPFGVKIKATEKGDFVCEW